MFLYVLHYISKVISNSPEHHCSFLDRMIVVWGPWSFRWDSGRRHRWRCLPDRWRIGNHPSTFFQNFPCFLASVRFFSIWNPRSPFAGLGSLKKTGAPPHMLLQAMVWVSGVENRFQAVKNVTNQSFFFQAMHDMCEISFLFFYFWLPICRKLVTCTANQSWGDRGDIGVKLSLCKHWKTCVMWWCLTDFEEQGLDVLIYDYMFTFFEHFFEFRLILKI